MSDPVRPHRQQPTRLPRPWDSLGKNTGLGCHFPLQCMKVKSESEVVQSLWDPMDCSLPGFSIHGICQARVLEWVAIAFSNIIVYVSINKSEKINFNSRLTSILLLCPKKSHKRGKMSQGKHRDSTGDQILSQSG